MKQIIIGCFLLALIWMNGTGVRAGIAFPDPPGGWTYIYNGDQLTVGTEGSGWTSLDGTWSHDNNSDAWDGSQIGNYSLEPGLGFGTKNAPGGALLGTQAGVSYLRMQDCGDPRDYDTSAGEWDDPSSRKIYFGHNIGSDIDQLKAQTIIRTGVTLTFRARIPTLAKAGPPLDPLHRDGQNAAGVKPYPEEGDGYVTSDGGKGNFVIREGGNTASGGNVPAAAIAFSLTLPNDTTGGDPNGSKAGFAGLTFNEFNGNTPTDQVNFGQGSKTNVVAFDPTEWHELYIVIRDDPADIGTHEAFIFRDGLLTPTVFKITGGTGADMNDSFLALGGSATPQNWALDVDWFGYKDEAVFPPGALLPPTIFGFAPVDRATFHPPANGLKFSSSALMPTNRLPASGIKVILNGQDVSSQLVLTGNDTSQSRTVTYNGLQANQLYTATYMVTDSGGLSVTNDIAFDTFVEAQVTMIESEDYNLVAGQFFDNPQPGAYGGMAGTADIDFRETTPSDFSLYRNDAVDLATSTDVARNKFIMTGVADYMVQNVVSGEWLNYTRTITAGRYYLYLRAGSTVVQSFRLDRVTAGANQTGQTLEFLGNITVPRTGSLNVFNYFPLTDVQGLPIPLPLGGQTTLRLTALGANGDVTHNFLVLAPVGALPADPRVSTVPSPGATGVGANAPVEIAIFDGVQPVDQATVKLRIDGAEVPAVVTKTGGLTSVKYAPSNTWSPAMAYALNLTFSDGTARSFEWSFTTANFGVLTPAMKVNDAQTEGFLWRMFQNEANQDTTIQRAEDALAGRLKDGNGQPLPNLADANSTGPASGPGTPAQPGVGLMTFTIPTVINVSQTSGTSWGAFTPDEQMPGIPGLTPSTDGISVEVLTFIQLPSGVITMGINSDDGFRTYAGFLKDTPLILGELDGGRSAADTLFQFVVQEAGVYAFRTVYLEGGSDASLEWFTLKPDGNKVLLNDTASGGLRAYQTGTVPNPPKDVKMTIKTGAQDQVVIEWSSGVLQSSDTVNGSYQNVPQATSPYSTLPMGPQKFYRVKVQ